MLASAAVLPPHTDAVSVSSGTLRPRLSVVPTPRGKSAGVWRKAAGGIGNADATPSRRARLRVCVAGGRAMRTAQSLAPVPSEALLALRSSQRDSGIPVE
jgi:hypothetical protein